MSTVDRRGQTLSLVLLCLVLFMAPTFIFMVGAPPPPNPVGSQVGNVLTEQDIYFTGSLYQGLDSTNVTDVLKYPELGASYTIWADAGVYYAKNGHTGVVTSNANPTTLTQATLAALLTDGGTIYFKPGTYTFTSSVVVTNHKPIKLVGYGAVFVSNANTFSILKIDQGTSMANGGCVVEGISFKNPNGNTAVVAIEVVDSFNAEITNVYVENLETGILATNWGLWTESLTIRKTVLNDTLNGVRFMLNAGTNSFGQLNMEDVFIHVPQGTVGTPTYGIFLPNGASIYRASIENVVMWIGGDHATGFYANGDFTDARIDMSFEALVGTPTSEYGAYIDVGATYGPQDPTNSSYSFTYNFRGTKFTERIYGYVEPLNLDLVTAGGWIQGNTTDTISYVDGVVVGNTTDTLTTVGGWIAGNVTTTTSTAAAPYSYICWESAGTCYANSTYGGTDYNGATESTVLQNAINAVEARGGGVVFLKASHYDLTAGLVIDEDNVVLMGEGYENTYLHVASGQDGITIGNGVDRVFSIGVEGIFIQNAGVYTTNSTGLLLKGNSHSYFRDLNIESFMYGVEVNSTVLTTYNRYDNIKCIGGMFGVYQYGAPSDNQGHWSQLNLIGAGKAVAGSIGWRHLCGNSNTWESVSVESYETAIDLDIGPTGWNLNNRFVGVFIEDCDIGIQYNAARPGARAQFIGLWVATTATIIDNYSPTRSIDFTGLLVTSSGARARNMGTTSVASGATIAHGLALGITPRICTVTISGATPYKISYTVDATNITVYHDAGGAVNVTWYVEI